MVNPQQRDRKLVMANPQRKFNSRGSAAPLIIDISYSSNLHSFNLIPALVHYDIISPLLHHPSAHAHRPTYISF